MKDLVKGMPKALSVNNGITLVIIFVIVIGVSSCAAFQSQNRYVSHQQYQVINDFFDARNSDKAALIYYKTYENKAWKDLFNREDIIELSGIPSSVTTIEIKKILNNEVLDSIKFKIEASKSLKLDGDNLKNIMLSKSLKKVDGYSISVPIIVGSIAIFRRTSKLETPIHIMRKENGKLSIPFMKS